MSRSVPQCPAATQLTFANMSWVANANWIAAQTIYVKMVP